MQWLIFGIVVLVYALTLTRNYYWDGIDFALTIQGAGELSPALLHPNHLVYNLFGFVIYRVVSVFGDVRSLYVLQYINCIAGGACAVFLFRILNSVMGQLKAAFWLTLLFAFSATWWKFATDADAYILSVLFLLAAFYHLISSREPSPFVVAVLHIGSMCFHELAVLFLPAAMVGLWLRTPAKRMTSPLLYAATAGVTMIAVYAGAFYWMTGGFGVLPLFRWMTSSSGETGFGFEAVRNLGYTLSGQFKLFVGGRFGSFAEVYQPLAFVLAAILLAAVCGLAASIVQYRRTPKNAVRVETQRVAVTVAGLWVAVYFAFLIIWEPQHTFYRLFYFPAAIILIGLWLRRFDLASLSRRVLPLTVAVVATINLLFYIIPYSQVRPGTPLALALEMNAVWPCGTRVMYLNRSSDLQTLQYFNRQTRWDRATASELLALMPQSAEIWIDDSLAKDLKGSDEGDSWLTANSLSEVHLDRPYAIRLTKITATAGALECAYIR